MVSLPGGPRRLIAAVAALGAASCFLPSEPTERISFELIFGSAPFRVPLGRTKAPIIIVHVGDRTLSNPTYRLEVENKGIVRVDGNGQALFGIARGQTPVRVVYTGSTGIVDTTFVAHVVVSSVTVSPSNVLLRRIGATEQMTAQADAADSTQSGANVPSHAFAWSSDDATIATVSSTGLVTAVDDGIVRIRATLDDVEGQVSVRVLQAASVVQILPELDTLRTLGRVKEFFAFALDSTGAPLEGAKPKWTSSNTTVARIDPATGIATADSAGTTLIVARVGLAADTATLVVKQVVRFLFVSPALDTLTAIQDSARLAVRASDSAFGQIPLSDIIIDGWTSADPSIATVDADGLVIARGNGSVLVNARSGTQSAFARIVVRQEVARAQITEDAVTLTGAGATMQLTATAEDKNGFPVPGAGGLEWRSHLPLVATVDANGLVTAQGNGRTAISVSVAGRSDAATVTVTGAPQELIAFASSNGIEAIRADGTLRTLLIPNTNTGGYCYYYYYCSTAVSDPAWSPDGTRLTYAMSTYDYAYCYYGCADVYSSWPDGSDAINLTGSLGYSYDPAWSPDGQRIAFASNREGGPTSIYVMNADGSNIRRVTTQGGARPQWSPDGSKIAFEWNDDVFVVNADGTSLMPLTTTGASDGHPAWSPDGMQIAFRSDRAGRSDIWLMSADGSGAVNLTAGLAYPGNPAWTGEGTPAWSPDGSRISYAAGHCFEDEYGSTSCHPDALYIVNRDGTGMRPLNANGWDPAWHAAGSLSPAAALRRAAGTRR